MQLTQTLPFMHINKHFSPIATFMRLANRMRDNVTNDHKGTSSASDAMESTSTGIKSAT